MIDGDEAVVNSPPVGTVQSMLRTGVMYGIVWCSGIVLHRMVCTYYIHTRDISYVHAV
jgi:hypothetical protein